MTTALVDTGISVPMLGHAYQGGYLIDHVNTLRVLGTDTVIPMDSLDVRIPIQAIRMYGCLTCEWKGSNLCKFFSDKDDPGSMKICEDRLTWLKGFSSGYKDKPSFTQWQRDYNLGIGELMSNKERYRYEQVQRDLDFAVSDLTNRYPNGKPSLTNLDKMKDVAKVDDMSDAELAEKTLYEDYKSRKDKIIELKSELIMLKSNWGKIWEKVTEFRDRQVDRETPKKVDMTVKKLTLQDIHNVMSGDVVDAEYKDSDDKQ